MNREVAMKILVSKLTRLAEEAHKENLNEIKGDQSMATWGSQIRNYVFQPYTMVKDTRTGAEVGNVDAVMDGDIDVFVRAKLSQDAQEAVDNIEIPELTPEAIQQVMPIAWSEYTKLPTLTGINGTAFGGNAIAKAIGTSIGSNANSDGQSASVGYNASSKNYSTSIGNNSSAMQGASVSVGYFATTAKASGITIGSQFSDTAGSYTCTTEGTGSITIGAGANTLNNGDTESSNSVTIGCKAENKGADSVVIGAQAKATKSAAISIGAGANAFELEAIAIGKSAGANWKTVAIGANTVTSSGSVAIGHASNSGQNGVVIGYGAKITSTGDTKSANTTVIGYGASASAPNAVVLGAGASTAGEGTIIIGAGTSLAAGSGNITNAILIGTGAKSSGEWASGSIALGVNSTILGDAAYAIGSGSESRTGGIAIGTGAKVGDYSNAFGYQCVNRNNGTTSFRQQKSMGETYTQFYIMAAESPLAVQYEEGEACMGYVVKHKTTGELLAAGTQKLSVLFPNNSTFQPATVDENGEYVQPKVFHPSDLDLPIEEPTEPEDVEINIPEHEVEEYTPLPVYPIVEPEMEEIE
jgi:hypothetical protein